LLTFAGMVGPNREKEVGFYNTNNRLKPPGTDDDCELIRNVCELVECFVQSEGNLHIGAGTVDDSVAGNALVAATQAERLIKELSGRVRELEKLAMTDELTGLMNRRGFEIELSRALSSARRSNERGVLIYIDLDDFKPVNDQLGHAAGDEVLRYVGRLLAHNIRDTDYIARLGGDEFAVLMPRTIWGNGLTRASVIEDLLNASATIWEGRTIDIRASLGLQRYSAGDDPSVLLQKADAAMYKTKKFRTAMATRNIGQQDIDEEPAGRSLQNFLYAAS